MSDMTICVKCKHCHRPYRATPSVVTCAHPDLQRLEGVHWVTGERCYYASGRHGPQCVTSMFPPCETINTQGKCGWYEAKEIDDGQDAGPTERAPETETTDEVPTHRT